MAETFAAKNRRVLPVMIVIASGIFAYVLTFRLPFTPFLIEADHHIFLYEGMRLVDGDVMYRDFFQFTFPGSQVFYWSMFSLFGLDYWILGIAIIGITALAALAGLLVSKYSINGWYFVLPPMVYVFFGFRWFGIDGSHRMFSPFLIMFAIWAVLSSQDLSRLIFAGFFCALASFFTQQRGVLAVSAIVLFFVVEGKMLKRPLRETAASAAVVGGAFLAFLLLFCAYFVAAAGFDAFYTATLEYPLKYYRYSPHNNLGTLLYNLNAALSPSSPTTLAAVIPAVLYVLVLPGTYLAFWALFLLRGRDYVWDFWRPIVPVAITGTILTVATFAAPNADRLYQIAMPGLIVLVWLLVYLKDHITGVTLKILRIALPGGAVLLLLTAIVQGIRIQTIWDYQVMDTPSGRLAYLPDPAIDGRYPWLLQRTRPGDFVFEIYEPFVYFPLHLRNPTSYGQIWDTNYSPTEHVATTIEQLKANPTRYIVWDNLYNKPPELRQPGDNTGLLSDYVLENYRPAGETIALPERHIQIWERKR